jgi:hypothetical protein
MSAVDALPELSMKKAEIDKVRPRDTESDAG